MIRTDLGIATAYAEAVSKGYTGTRDEFGKMFVDFGKTAEKVTEDKKAVEQIKLSVEETKNSVDTTASEFGQNVADKTEEAKAAITEHANTEKASATAAISEAKDAATGAITEAQTSATDAIAAVKDSATAEITKKGTDTLATIPEDYTVLTKDVSSLKEDLSNKITKFYASNQGETHITDSDNGKIQDMMIYGKSSQDGRPTADNPVEIKSVVNPTVKVSNEDLTKIQSVTLNNITLNAILVSSGGNVTIDGRQYIADYVDVERGKHIQMIQTDKVQSNVKWTVQKQQNGYSLGYINLYANGISTNNPGMGNTWKSNMGDSSASWGSNSFSFGRSTVFWIIPYENDGNITSDDINTWLTEHPMDIMYPLAEPIETDLAPKETEAFKALATSYSVTNISVNSEQLDGYTVFNYPLSMANGWNYVKQQLNDNRDYIYDMDLQSAEAYVNSEYAVALTELEV